MLLFLTVQRGNGEWDSPARTPRAKRTLAGTNRRSGWTTMGKSREDLGTVLYAFVICRWFFRTWIELLKTFLQWTWLLAILRE